MHLLLSCKQTWLPRIILSLTGSSEPKAAVSLSIKELLCIFSQQLCVPGTTISLSRGRAHFQHIPHSLFLSIVALLLFPLAARSHAFVTHQHSVEAFLQLFFRWHREFRSGCLSLGPCGPRARWLAILSLRNLKASCCIPHDWQSNRSKKHTYAQNSKEQSLPESQKGSNVGLSAHPKLGSV